MTAVVLRHDAGSLPLPDRSVDLIATSPPYFGLRVYADGDGDLDGQIGGEGAMADYLAGLWRCSREWWRLLADDGSLWVNLGDSYRRGGGTGDARAKSLMGVPWRYAAGMIDGDGDPDGSGWILRAEVIWSKTSISPANVRDRVERSHEQWFHFTKQPRYYSAIDRIREPSRYVDGAGRVPWSVRSPKLSVLKVPEHLRTRHFASFPVEWPRWIVEGWSPERRCLDCGQGVAPTATKRTVKRSPNGKQVKMSAYNKMANVPRNVNNATRQDIVNEWTITGEACGCNTTPTRTVPGVVLDPFGGTGTTAVVASHLGRLGITNDLSADYNRIARWRATDPKLAQEVRDTSYHHRQQGRLSQV